MTECSLSYLRTMSNPPRPLGRAALLAAMERGAPGASQAPQAPVRSTGRGALLAALRGQSTPGVGASASEPASEPRPMARGRAAMLEKALRAMTVGGTSPELQKTVEAPKPPAPTPTYEEETSDEPVKFSGTSGKQIRLTANYISLSIDRDKGVFEYEVQFSSPLDSKNLRIKVLNSVMSKLGGTKSYDGGHCLYLPIKLPEVNTYLDTDHPGDGSTIQVIVKYKKQKKLKDCVHLFNVLFKRIMRTLLMFQFNRNYFDLKSTIFIPQYKLEVLPGYAVTCDDYEGGLLICLDAQHRLLRTQTVYDLLLELKHMASDRFKEEACKLILGNSVLTRYNTKTYVIHDICWEACPKNTFTTSLGKEISYIEYYKLQHNIDIKDHNQPLLIHKQKLKKVGIKGEEEERMVCLVPEICHLTGLTDKMREDFKVMQAVAQHTRLSPAQRMHALKAYLRRVNESPEAKKILSDWGLRLQDATIDLNARMLEPEKIFFGNGEITVGPKLEWGNDMAKHRVCQPVDLVNWTVIHTQRDKNGANEFIQMMLRLGQSMGCRISNPKVDVLPNDRTNTVIQQVKNYITTDEQCIVIICPTQRQDLYSAIKKLCCVQHPIASQVILGKTLSKANRLRSVVQKIALQINCKLGGQLWHLHFPVKRWMVLGIDTYHSPGSNFSWFGFVASLNDSFTRYYSTAVKQGGELGDNVRFCFTKALVKYREVLGYFPTKIIVFRDGVGDGDLDRCKQYEIAQIKECLRANEVEADICFIVVQKRINTRLFGVRNGTLENPGAGTVVDHTITRKYMSDFFLVPQHVGQGTVTPTHYIVLENTSQLTPDIIQKLTYKMCHLYYNWSGTIRVPAPCQYAHKLAYLVGQSIQTTPAEKLSTRLYYL